MTILKIACYTAYYAACVTTVFLTLSLILYPFARVLQNKFRHESLKKYEHPFIDDELIRTLCLILSLCLAFAGILGIAILGSS